MKLLLKFTKIKLEVFEVPFNITVGKSLQMTWVRKMELWHFNVVIFSFTLIREKKTSHSILVLCPLFYFSLLPYYAHRVRIKYVHLKHLITWKNSYFSQYFTFGALASEKPSVGFLISIIEKESETMC